MEIYDVINKLIGKIEPYGDSNIDKERMENLKIHVDIIYKMIEDLIEVAKYKNRPEYSIRVLALTAYEELLEIKRMIDNEIETETK